MLREKRKREKEEVWNLGEGRGRLNTHPGLSPESRAIPLSKRKLLGIEKYVSEKEHSILL